jgi:hypothetical protein
LSKQFLSHETKQQRKSRKNLEKNEIREQNLIVEKITPLTTDTHVAFVLGNGVSRQCIDPLSLKIHGTTYGCNALYREFSPDYLIAVDTKMIREITSAGYHKTHSVWTNSNKYSKEISGINLFNPNLGWSSGPSALNLASGHANKTIYILGFDYKGIGNKNELVNNLYTGSPNYKNTNDRATYFGNWQRQTTTCIKSNSTIKYIRVIETASSFIPDTLIGIANLTHITIDNFKKKFRLV